MEALVEAGEATMTALVTAADDFARPLVAAQRAALDAAVAAVIESSRVLRGGSFRSSKRSCASSRRRSPPRLSEEREAITALAAAARADANADEAAVAARFDPARAALGGAFASDARTPKPPRLARGQARNLTRAAESDAGADAPGADTSKQDWAADDDDEDALPPLAAVGWAEDDEDELPPLEPRGQTSPRRPRPRDRLPSPSNPATIPPTLPAEVSFRA